VIDNLTALSALATANMQRHVIRENQRSICAINHYSNFYFATVYIY